MNNTQIKKYILSEIDSAPINASGNLIGPLIITHQFFEYKFELGADISQIRRSFKSIKLNNNDNSFLQRPIKDKKRFLSLKYIIDAPLGPDQAVSNYPIPGSPRKTLLPKKLTIIGDCDYVTNGHFMILKSLMPVKKMRNSDITRELKAITVNKFFKYHINKKSIPIYEIGRYKIFGTSRHETTEAIFYDGKNIFSFNARYIDYFYQKIDGFNLESIGYKIAIIKSVDKKVGLLAGINIPDTSPLRNWVIKDE